MSSAWQVGFILKINITSAMNRLSDSVIFLIFLVGCSNDPLYKIYYNGNIWTGDHRNPFATAIVVNDQSIIYVGNDADALQMAFANSTKINLFGNFVTPGLIDNHVHFISGGLQLSRIDLNNVFSKKEFQKRLIKYDKNLPDGAWILGGNWDHELWGGQYPDKSWIDDVISNRPVLLDRLDGHMALANTEALFIAKISSDIEDPDGGIIIKDEKNNPTGILKDNAIRLVSSCIPDPSQSEMDDALNAAMNHAISLGVTQVHDMGSWEDLQTYIRNHKNGNLKIRIKIYPWYTSYKSVIQYVKQNGSGDDWLRWDGLKGMIDGSLGSKTAWMHKPYLSDDFANEEEKLSTMGILTIEDTIEFKRILRMTDRAGIQHAVHAIGDRANDWILNEYAKINNEIGDRERRPRIEHSQHLSKTALKRFGEENIIPSMQPYHLYDDGSWAHKRIGNDLLSRSYAFKTLLESGANVTFGSDWTVAPLNPMLGMYAAVTRRTRDGKNQEGWFPLEKITIEDALKSYTIRNAYAAFWEGKTGSIEKGKYADFVVHSINLLQVAPEKIAESHVIRTVISGKDYQF